jgi:hypothetical protein
MDTLKLTELIGQEISDITFHYTYENEYGLQSFDSYIKLTNDHIIDIPIFYDNDYLQLSEENIEYLKSKFEKGKKLEINVKKYLVGQRILDFLFCYNNNELEMNRPCYIKLSNGYFLTETNFAPPGIGIGLLILTEKELNKRNIDFKIDIISFVDKQKNAC